MKNQLLILDEYTEFLKIGIPKPSEVQKTFFDIGGFGHRENIVSNFYSYYLDKEEMHGLGDIFLVTLLKLINKKSIFSTEWSNWEVSREVTVNMSGSTGKIDLWIEELDEERKVILIENKVYHHVKNDLKGYLDSVDIFDKKHKIGVLLTVKPLQLNVKGFINITHSNWIEEIKKEVRVREIKQNSRELFIFNDFCRNFKTHVKHSRAMMERHLFYLKNRKKIKALAELETDYKRACLIAIENVVGEYEFDIDFKSRLNGSPVIDIEILSKPRIWIRYRINDNPSQKPVTVELSFNNRHYAPRAKGILKRSAIFNKFKVNKIEKANLSMSEYPNEDLIIAFKDYSFADLKKDSLEDFVTATLDEDWIPFRDEVAKLYKKVNR